ncbi:hypothetical protein IGI37_003787 [Enterococcus sp. AZ194]|uniref:GntR family transcriptional regulator n=1 Tax=Enterococcus sp. AZ194 TaxID=2774629 RepID=UPI003F25D71F
MSTPLYEKIYKDIKQKIVSGEYPKKFLLPSEKALAKAYNVSTITTKRALAILVEEGYITRKKGRGTFVNEVPTPASSTEIKPYSIGVILSEITAHYGIELLNSIESTLSKKANMILKISHEKDILEEKAVNDLIEAQVDGIVVLPRVGDLVNKELVHLAVSDFPIVMIDRTIQVLQQPSVVTDNTTAIYTALQHFIAHGHETISIMFSQLNDNVAQERLQAVTQFGFDTGIQFSKKYFLSDLSTSGPTISDKDVQKVKEHLLKYPEITAILALNYTIANIIRIAAEQIGRKIGKDLSIICFDSPFVQYGIPEFTHIKQNETLVGKQAVELLFQLLEGTAKEKNFKIDAQLIEGLSTY